MAETKLTVPVSIVTRSDVGRLVRVLDNLEAALKRKTASKKSQLLPTSPLIDDISAQNKLNLLQADDRTKLGAFLAELHSHGPQLHFSFSTDPSPRFLADLLSWLRREIDPRILLKIGLEPALGAGCVVRTTNRQFDFSLRQHFGDQRDMLIGKLKEAV